MTVKIFFPHFAQFLSCFAAYVGAQSPSSIIHPW